MTASLSLENFEKIRLVFGEALEKIRNAGITDRNILGSLVSVDQRVCVHSLFYWNSGINAVFPFVFVVCRTSSTRQGTSSDGAVIGKPSA